MRDAMLHAVPNRATDEVPAPLEHTGGAIIVLKRAPLLPSAIRIGRPTAVALT